MANTLDSHLVTYPLDGAVWDGTAVLGHILKVPPAARGGAVTLMAAHAVNGAATTSGTSFHLTLLRYDSAGTGLAGTVSATLGGTAAPFAAGSPAPFTLTDPTLNAGEWLVVRKGEDGGSSDPTRAAIVIEYLVGK